MDEETIKSEVASIKRSFYAYRNGIVADALRRAGDPHHFIMGCQLVDIASIARQYGHLACLAEALWKDTESRESRMIAPMLYPPAKFTQDKAETWAQSVECNEIADVLCHRLLRNLDYAPDLFRVLLCYETPQVRYVAFRLLLNLIIVGKVKPSGTFKSLVDAEMEYAPTPAMRQLLASLMEEF